MNIALFSIGVLRNHKESARITTTSLAKSLTNKGHKVIIITEQAEGLPVSEQIGDVLIYRPYKFPMFSKLFSHAFALRKIQKELNIKFDIIHSFSATPLFVISSRFAKLFAPQAKLIHTLKSYSKNKFSNYFYPLLNFVDKITIPTQVFSNKLKYVKKKKINLIYSPISLNKFYPQSKNEIKKRYNYQNKKIIFYYGAVWENKGINILLRSIPKLIEKNSDLLLICAPRYNKIEEQRKLVTELGLQNSVQFITGDIPIEEYVNLADVIALPYKNLVGTEGNPSCMLEAMACKTLVVTTDLPELREIVRDCVIMAKPGDVNSLVDYLNYALHNDFSEMIERAYQKSLQFDLDKISDQFLRLYRETKGLIPFSK